MRVRLLAFARLRELLGWSEREYDAPDGASLDDLWQSLARECTPLAALRPSTRVAMNGALVRDWHTSVNGGDEIAFLPPSSGG
jgi:molybdopterin converting factor small subunit